MTNPFTSAQAPASMQLLAPDIATQQNQLMRQQQMADILRQQSMTPMGDTQMVGNWAVKRSPWEGIAKLAQALGANYAQSNADEKQLGLAKAMQERTSSAFDSMIGSSGSQAPASIPVSPMAKSSGFTEGEEPPSAPVAPPAQAQQAPALSREEQITNKARAAFMLGNTAYGNDLLKSINTMTEGERTDRYLGISPDQSRQAELAKRNKEGTMSYQPGQTNVMPDGSRIVAPNFETGVAGGFDAQGNPTAMEIPGSTAIAAGRAGAVAGATSGANANNETVVVNVNGRPTTMTKAQAVQMAGGSQAPAPQAQGGMPAPAPTSPQGQPPINISNMSPAERATLMARAKAQFDLQPGTQPGTSAVGAPTGRVAPSVASNNAAPSGSVGIQGSTPEEDAARLSKITFNTGLLKSAHEGNMATLDKLHDTVRSEAELQNRNAQLMPMLDKIQTGGFNAEGRIGLANAIQTSGLLPDSMKGKVSQWLAAGDPTTGKVLENQLAAAGIKTMLDTLDKEGKPNRAIFDAIHNAQESVKSGNGTLKQVFALQSQLYDMHYAQEQEMAHSMAAPDYNPLTLQADFSKRRNASLKTMPIVAKPPAATGGFKYLGKE